MDPKYIPNVIDWRIYMDKTLKIILIIMVLSLSACNSLDILPSNDNGTGNGGPAAQPGGGNPGTGAGSGGGQQGGGSGGGGGMGTGQMGGMGGMGGMRGRHMAQIPAEFKGLKNPVESDQASLLRGQEIFTLNCSVCHGDGGMGDGPGMPVLDPAPAPLAHTSQMLGDDYLFWRITMGGNLEPFNSGMPAWEEVLDEQARWDVINYVRALGRGEIEPREQSGGSVYDPQLEAQMHTEMLQQAQSLGIISAEEAETFELAHQALDKAITEQNLNQAGSMDEIRDQLLNQMVENGELTAEQVSIFHKVHDLLVEAGLME
jgi:mono/diheme cytochrome c family protein